MVIAVDAMGGDNAPSEVVKGAVKAVNETPNLEVILVGNQAVIEKELAACSKQEQSKIQIEHTNEFITMDDHPAGKLPVFLQLATAVQLWLSQW